MENIETIQDQFPFLSCIQYHTTESICIIQNSDEKFISFYDLNMLKTEDDRKRFLDMGDIWWWESNRILPISIFIGLPMREFRYCLRTIARKDTEIIFGPCISLKTIVKKRIKRRQISLVIKA